MCSHISPGRDDDIGRDGSSNLDVVSTVEIVEMIELEPDEASKLKFGFSIGVDARPRNGDEVVGDLKDSPGGVGIEFRVF
jgi:hypothetical protein